MTTYTDEALMDKLGTKTAAAVKWLIENGYVDKNFYESNRGCLPMLDSEGKKVLTENQMRTIKSNAQLAGFIDVERRGKPNKIYYSVNLKELEYIISKPEGLGLKY